MTYDFLYANLRPPGKFIRFDSPAIQSELAGGMKELAGLTYEELRDIAFQEIEMRMVRTMRLQD